MAKDLTEVQFHPFYKFFWVNSQVIFSQYIEYARGRVEASQPSRSSVFSKDYVYIRKVGAGKFSTILPKNNSCFIIIFVYCYQLQVLFH